MVSVAQAVAAIEDPASQRAILALLQSMRQDIANLKLQLDTHQHAAFNAAPTSVSPTLNTSA